MPDWNDIPEEYLTARPTASRTKSKDRRIRTPLSSVPPSAPGSQPPSRPPSVPPKHVGVGATVAKPPPLSITASSVRLEEDEHTTCGKELHSPIDGPQNGRKQTQTSGSNGSLASSPRPALVLPQPNEETHTWQFLLHSIFGNTLSNLSRTPSQESAYTLWRTSILAHHDSITTYMLTQRLHWDPNTFAQGPTRTSTSGDRGGEEEELFAEGNYRVVRNDWPYALPGDVSHICVWLKRRIPTTLTERGRERGELSKEGWRACNDFVRRTFVEPLNSHRDSATTATTTTTLTQNGEKEVERWPVKYGAVTNGGGDGRRVIWFKNWIEGQSVRGIEHFHVLVRGAPRELLGRWMQ